MKKSFLGIHTIRKKYDEFILSKALLGMISEKIQLALNLHRIIKKN